MTSRVIVQRKQVLILVLVAAGVAAGMLLSARRHSTGAPAVTVAAGRPQLLEFGMGLCEQCKRMKPVMAQAQRELEPRVDVQELDIRVEQNAQVGRQLGLRVIPTVMLVDPAGSVTWRHEGFIPFAELAAAVDQQLARPGRTP